MKGPALLAVGGLLLLQNCTLSSGDYELDNISVSPEIVVPLAAGNLSIKDILDQTDSTYIKVYPDGLVYLSYQDTLITQDIRNLIDVPDLGNISRNLDFPSGTYPPSNTDAEATISSSTIDMGINPEKLTEIAFKSGSLNYSTNLVPSNSNIPFDVKIDIPEFKDPNGNPLSTVISGSDKVSLIGYTYKSAVANSFTLNLTLVIKKHNNTYTVLPGTQVDVVINYSGADFKYIKGFFGDQTANPPAQSLDIGTFGTFLEDGTVSFAQPKIALEVISDYGVPLELTFADLQARKEGSSIPILINPSSPFDLNQPATLGQSATTNVSVTNVNQIFNFGPSQFYYRVSGRINSGLTSGVNFMADTSKMRIRMDVELPMYGKASNIELADTTEIDLSDMDASKIETAQIKALITNQLPLDGDIQLNLLDENDILIVSLLSASQTHIVKGSTVTANGEFQTAGVFDDFINIDPTNVNKIFSAKKIGLSVTLNTSKNSAGNQVDVKFKSDLKIDVKLGLKLKLKLKSDL